MYRKDKKVGFMMCIYVRKKPLVQKGYYQKVHLLTAFLFWLESTGAGTININKKNGFASISYTPTGTIKSTTPLQLC